MIPHIEREIYSQGAAWRSAIDAVGNQASALHALMSRAGGDLVRFVGSGSSYYLGVAATPSWGRRGWVAHALPSAEQLLHGESHPPSAPLVVAVSRSGSTTETLRALERLRDRGSRTIGITTRVGSAMDDACDVTLHVTGADERSTVQTRSFSAQLLAAQLVAAVGGGDAVPAELDALPAMADGWISGADTHVQAHAARHRRIFVLGTGSRWGLAMEGALKLKEASLTESEAFHTLEFRHGPISMVDDETLVVGLIGGETADVERAVLSEARALGAETLAVGADLGPSDDANVLALPAGARPDTHDVLYLPPLQLLAYRRALHKGLDPDKPRNLSFAVELTEI